SYFLRIFPYLYLFFPALVYSWFCRNKEAYKHIWLICERGDEARDNGYHLYKYIREHHPEVNVYFVITDTSPDLPKVEKYQNMVKTNSFQHYLYFILAEKALSTHIHGAAPNGKACLPFLKLIPEKKHVFLKHGLTKDKFIFNDNYVDLLVCASRFELKSLKFSNDNIRKSIQLLGFCMYDKLIDKSKSRTRKVILIIPTFRRWLEDLSRLPNSDQHFREDPYFIKWNALINDRKLIDKLERSGMKIIFYPHYRTQKFIHNFKSNSKNVIIADNHDYDIQDLLINSSMMITDFSSVFFDFAYMKKPIVYYQFDKKTYRNKNYKEGTFVYENDAFGPVYNQHHEVVNYVIKIVDQSFLMEEVYINRLKGFFEFEDNKNTERNFRAISKL